MSAVDDDLEPTSTAPNSVWADLRRQHERIASDVDPLYLPIPGYDGIVAKYRYVELDETKASSNAAARIRDITDQARTASIDSLILALEEIQVMAADGVRPTGRGGNELFSQPLKSLADPGEPPIRFDERLCEGMGFPKDLKARQIVRRFFGGDDRAIMEHAVEVGEWMSTARRAVAEDLAGK